MPINVKQLSGLLDAGGSGENPYVQGKNQQQLEKLKSMLQGQAQETALQRLQQYMPKDANGNPTLPQGAGISLGPEGASMTRQPNTMLPFQREKQQQHQENAYAKGLEKYSDVHGALLDLERVTNRDGQGGILTNPKASLVSAGTTESAIPDSALGIAEKMGVVQPGTSEERKAIARVKLSMGHAMTGARMNPTMQKMIQESMGGMASGDPQLMTKGLRGAAGIVGSQVHTVQSGFDDNTRQTVHDRLGGDPMDLYSHIVKDAPTGSGIKVKQPATPPQDGFDPSWMQ